MNAEAHFSDSRTLAVSPYFFVGFQHARGRVQLDLLGAAGYTHLEFQVDYVTPKFGDRRIAFSDTGFQGVSIADPVRSVSVFFAPALPFNRPVNPVQLKYSFDFYDVDQTRNDYLSIGFLAHEQGRFEIAGEIFRVVAGKRPTVPRDVTPEKPDPKKYVPHQATLRTMEVHPPHGRQRVAPPSVVEVGDPVSIKIGYGEAQAILKANRMRLGPTLVNRVR
jgi:hypothetical protein